MRSPERLPALISGAELEVEMNTGKTKALSSSNNKSGGFARKFSLPPAATGS
jgi:hypothetical protein